MSSRYAKPVSIPAGFPEILRDFAREVLRQQGVVDTKEAIYSFGVKHLREAIEKRDNTDASKELVSPHKLPLYMTLSEERIQEIIAESLKKYLDQNILPGRMTVHGFKQAMQHIAQELHLNSTELDALYAEAKEQAGQLNISSDFVMTVCKIVLFLRSTKQQRTSKAALLNQRYESKDIMLHGMMQDELESLLREICQRADSDESAVLSRANFLNCLKDEDLGFSQRELNILMMEAPFDSEKDSVLYFDFISMCFVKLKQLYHDGIVNCPNDQDEVAQQLIKALQERDQERTGFVTVSNLVQTLITANMGLTKLQAVMLAAEAQENDHGLIDYEAFAEKIAPMALFFVEYECQQQLADFSERFRKDNRFYTVFEMNQPAFERKLSTALAEADQNKSGALYREDMAEAIENTFPEITRRELRCLMALPASTATEDKYEYDTVIRYGFRSLQLLQEYDTMIVES